jgi:hypothetical protein
MDPNEKEVVENHEDQISDVLECDADMFMAEAIILMEGKTLAERRRIGKTKSHRASLQAQLSRNQKDYANAKVWNNVAYALKNNRF